MRRASTSSPAPAADSESEVRLGTAAPAARPPSRTSEPRAWQGEPTSAPDESEGAWLGRMFLGGTPEVTFFF